MTDESFRPLVLAASGPVAVEFMSYGCAYCRALEPILQEVAERVKSTEPIFRVNVAVEHVLADRYGVASTPTLIMFLDGVEVGRVEGPSPNVASLLAAVTQPFAS